MFAEMQAIFTSVERLNHLGTTTPQESAFVVEEAKDQVKNWPARGEIEFKNLSVTYSSNLPPVLRDVSFKIPPRSHVGICGRTGSGKSTLTLGLWRLLEPIDGTIIIDDVDITKIGLQQLRSQLSIIPQVIIGETKVHRRGTQN